MSSVRKHSKRGQRVSSSPAIKAVIPSPPEGEWASQEHIHRDVEHMSDTEEEESIIDRVATVSPSASPQPAAHRGSDDEDSTYSAELAAPPAKRRRQRVAASPVGDCAGTVEVDNNNGGELGGSTEGTPGPTKSVGVNQSPRR